MLILDLEKPLSLTSFSSKRKPLEGECEYEIVGTHVYLVSF
jgi:hypothetical protein